MIKFLPYQKALYNDTSRYIIVNKGRQIGISTLFAYKAAMDCIFHNRNKIIVSASQRQSNHINSMISRYIETLIKLAKSKGINIDIVTNTKTELGFSNGKSIYTMPCSPNTIRGFSGDVWMDEYALYREDEEMITALQPIITHGYNIVITSTPLGQNNMFYSIFSDSIRYKDWKRYTISIHAAIKDGLQIDIDNIKRNMDIQSFQQEYECAFIDEATSYFPITLIKSCITSILPKVDSAEYYMGIDIGRTSDRTEIVVLQKVDELIYIVDTISLQNTSFDEQYNIISDTIIQYNPITCAIDKSGIGMQISEQLGARFPSVNQLSITNQLKLEMFTYMKQKMEQGLVKFLTDTTLIRQLHSVRKSFTAANNIRFDGARDASGHIDRAFATALGIYATKIGTQVPSIYFI